MKSSFNFEKSVKSTNLKVQTTKTGRSDQPMQKEYLTRFNIHLGFSKTQKKRKKKTRDFLNLYRKATKTKLHSLENSTHVHHCAKSLSQCNKIRKRKKHTAFKRVKPPLFAENMVIHIEKSQDCLPKTTANK